MLLATWLAGPLTFPTLAVPSRAGPWTTHLRAWTRLRLANSWQSTKAWRTCRLMGSLRKGQREGEMYWGTFWYLPPGGIEVGGGTREDRCPPSGSSHCLACSHLSDPTSAPHVHTMPSPREQPPPPRLTALTLDGSLALEGCSLSQILPLSLPAWVTPLKPCDLPKP